MANVRLVDLTKHYKRGSEVIKALDGVTLDIDKGEFVAVVGRSGSGKTTMLDLLGLLLKPTSGSLFIDDVDTARLNDRDRAHMRARRVGFVFQEYNLLSGLNVLENVMLPLRYVKDARRAGSARSSSSNASASPTASSTGPPSCPAARCSASPSHARCQQPVA